MTIDEDAINANNNNASTSKRSTVTTPRSAPKVKLTSYNLQVGGVVVSCSAGNSDRTKSLVAMAAYKLDSPLPSFSYYPELFFVLIPKVVTGELGNKMGILVN